MTVHTDTYNNNITKQSEFLMKVQKDINSRMTTTTTNNKEESDLTQLLLDLISDRIVKVAQDIRQIDLILNNEVLAQQYSNREVKELAQENADNWNYIKSLKRAANELKPGEYSEDETK